MSEISEQIEDIEKHLGVNFPNSYKKFLEEKGNDIIFGLPIYGLSPSLDIDSVRGATEALRLARPDLPSNFLAIRLLDSRALCILSDDNEDDPLFEIDIESKDMPIKIHDSFSKYLEESRNSEIEINEAFRRIQNLLNYEVKPYDRKAGEHIPFKARDWRVTRSCVHDKVVGLLAFRHNENFNGLEVDVFISTDHPDYMPGHGLSALVLMLLSEAYKNGATMEVRFTRFVKGSRVPDKIPKPFAGLFEENHIRLSKFGEGIITHDESVSLYASLLGISTKLKEKIRIYEAEKRLSLQGLCYIISSRIWTIEEVSWILFNCPRPEGVLFGKDLPEDRMRYTESLGYGRAAIALTKFKNKLENNVSENEGDSLVEADNRIWVITPKLPSEIDWLASSQSAEIIPDEKLAVLPRPSRAVPNEEKLVGEDILTLNQHAKEISKKFLLYSSDFSKVKNYNIIAKNVRDKEGIELLLLPYSSKELDDEVSGRISKTRAVRA